MAPESINAARGDIQYPDECSDNAICEDIEHTVLKKKKKIETPMYNSLMHYFFLHDKEAELQSKETCLYFSGKNVQSNHQEGTILSRYARGGYVMQSATKADCGMVNGTKFSKQNPGIGVIDKSVGVDNFRQSEDFRTELLKETSDKSPSRHIIANDNLNILLKSGKGTVYDETFDKVGVGYSPLITAGESKTIGLQLTKKNVETDKQSVNIKSELNSENAKTISQNNGEMTYHFKQWGGGHYINISMDSNGFLLKPSDNYVDSRLESLLSKDSDGNYLFDSRQQNKGNNNHSANDEQSEEEC